jgi:hypothetical protein
MGSANQVNIVFFIEAEHGRLTKSERDTSVIVSPSAAVLVRVRPDNIAQKSSVWNFGWSNNSFNLFKSAQLWAETSVHAQNFLVDQGGDRKAVENIGKSLPQLDVVSSLALIVEPINSVDGRALVVSSQKEEVLWELDFVSQQKADGLEALLSSVDVVSQEEVVSFRRESSVLEQSQKIEVLSVDITANFDWGFQLKEDWLLDEDLSGSLAQELNFFLSKGHLFAWFLPSDLEELVDNVVEINLLISHVF